MKIIKPPKFSKELSLIPFEVVSDNEVFVKYYEDGVQAGFPSPAEDFTEEHLSLDKKYLTNPNATYLVRVKGNSMLPTLQIDDILIVKSDVQLNDNDIVIVSVNSTEYTVKRFNKKTKQLIADNKDFKPIQISDDDILITLGVVKQLIRDV